MSKKTLFFHNCVGVFQGGGCRASAYVGAYKEATRRGIYFSSLVGTSAGALIAALIGAGAKADDLEGLVGDLDFCKLLTAPEAIKLDVGAMHKFLLSLPVAKKARQLVTSLGLYSSIGIQDWIEQQLRLLLPDKSGPIKFKHLKIPTTVVATDLKTQKVRLWSTETTPEDDVAYAVRASCSIPFFFQPVGSRYIDGGVLSNLPSFVSSDFESTVLAFSLKARSEPADVGNFKDFCYAIANSVVDGAQDIQMRLQDNVHIIEIDSGEIKSTDFDKMTKENISMLIQGGVDAVRDFIDNEAIHYSNGRANTNTCSSHSHSYRQIAQTVGRSVNKIIVSELDSEWVYDLFPTLLYWVQSRANVVAVFKNNNDHERHGPFRLRILEAMGVRVETCESLKIRGFLFNPDDLGNSFAIVRRLAGASNDSFDGVIYESPTDSQVIKSLGAQFSSAETFAKSLAPTLAAAADTDVTQALRTVHQYSGGDVNVYVAEVKVDELLFLTNYVLGYKYRQISHLFDAYAIAGIKLFKPAKVVYVNGKESLVGLPVLEKYGKNYYIINGNTRIKYCTQHGIGTIYAVIVEGATDPLPTSRFFSHHEVMVTDQPISGPTRYDSFNYTHYRQIEKSFRDPNTCLT